MIKKLVFLIVIFIFFLNGVSKGYSDNPVTLVTENENEIIVKFVLPSFSFNSVSVNGMHCTSIAADGASFHEQRGIPALPFYSQSIVLPPNTTVKTSVVHRELTTETIQRILPSKGPVSRTINPVTIPYTFGYVYNQDVFYPEQIVNTGKPYVMRNIHGVVLHFHPFQYNPNKNLMKISKSITVKLTKVRTTPPLGLVTTNNNFVSPSFDRMYKEHFINYNQDQKYSRSAVTEGDKMVIITTPEYSDALSALVEWKNRKGIFTELYEYPSETGGSGADNIKSFLEQKYDNDNITFILLVGDIDDIPSTYTSNLWDGQSGYTDPEYALLNGDDFFPDAFVGRLSVENVDEVHVMVSKILKYEKEPDINGDWYHKAIGIASTEGSPPDSTWMNYFRDTLLTYSFTDVDRFYGYSSSKTDLANAVNDGRSWITYMGHGYTSAWSTTGFSNSNITSLTNNERLPVIISVACLNGKFESTCFAEAWTRHSEGGAIAFLGSSINQAWTPPQYGADNMLSNLKQEQHLTLGGIVYNGEIDMLERTTSAYSTNAINATFLTWTLFGDPSLVVHTNTPSQLSVTHPQEVALGSQTLTIYSENDARVCLYSKSQNITATGVVSSGKLELTINPTSSDTIYVTGTKRNRVPYTSSMLPNPRIYNALLSKNMVNHKNFYFRKDNKSISVKARYPGTYTIVLCDSKGRTLAFHKITKYGQWTSINAPLSTGLYYLLINANEKSFIQKFYYLP